MYGYEIFHDELMQSLINTVHSGTCSHAYIFEGEKDLGIRNAARLFAAALTCHDKDIAPCGACSSCIESKADTNPDIVYINSGDKKSIGADKMREVEADAAIKPFAAKRKVYIIEDGTQLTEAAQNVFLKTFEEPPEYAVFIIIIENDELLLQTIRSRSTTVHFPNISDSDVRKYISENYPDETERLEFLVKYCGGIPKKADTVIADENFETLRTASLDKLPYLLSEKKLNSFTIQKFMEENKDSIMQILEFWLSFLRDILFLQTEAHENLINVDKKDILRRAAARINPEKIVKMADKVAASEKMSARYVNTKALAMWLALDTE